LATGTADVDASCARAYHPLAAHPGDEVTTMGDFSAGRIGRRELLRGTLVLGGGLTLAAWT
jgi:hypothetical protein